MSSRNKARRARNADAKRCLEIQSIPPSDEVVSWLSGSSCGLAAITLVKPADAPITSPDLSRSMGLVSEVLDNTLRLVTTCKHAFDNLTANYRLVVEVKHPNAPTFNRQGISAKCVATPILDPDPESDVAFIVIKDPLGSLTKPLTIEPTDPPFAQLQTLYNAGNSCVPYIGKFEIVVNRQVAGERREAIFCKMSDRFSNSVPLRDTQLHAKLLAEKWKQCRSFQMQSRAGNSGSPIWDEHLRLYGLDIRGTTPGDGRHHILGDVAICLPTSELYAARQRIQPQLEQRLREL